MQTCRNQRELGALRRYPLPVILQMCPAVGLITAMVAEQLYGLDICCQKQFLSFDRVMYRIWTVGQVYG